MGHCYRSLNVFSIFYSGTIINLNIVCVHVRACACVCVRACACLRVCLCACICVLARVFLCVHVRACACVCVHRYIRMQRDVTRRNATRRSATQRNAKKCCDGRNFGCIMQKQQESIILSIL